MKLETQRLMLRDVSLQDIDKIHKLHSMAETDRYNTLGIPDTIETTGRLVSQWIIEQQADPRASYVFCVELKEAQKFIGLMALKLGRQNFSNGEVWYKTHVAHWGRGYTTEALGALLGFAFDNLKLHRVEAGCAVENTASVKVLEKSGMIREGSKRKILPIRGEWKDNFMYAILEEDFYKKK